MKASFHQHQPVLKVTKTHGPVAYCVICKQYLHSAFQNKEHVYLTTEELREAQRKGWAQ